MAFFAGLGGVRVLLFAGGPTTGTCNTAAGVRWRLFGISSELPDPLDKLTLLKLAGAQQRKLLVVFHLACMALQIEQVFEWETGTRASTLL